MVSALIKLINNILTRIFGPFMKSEALANLIVWVLGAIIIVSAVIALGWWFNACQIDMKQAARHTNIAVIDQETDRAEAQADEAVSNAEAIREKLGPISLESQTAVKEAAEAVEKLKEAQKQDSSTFSKDTSEVFQRYCRLNPEDSQCQ